MICSLNRSALWFSSGHSVGELNRLRVHHVEALMFIYLFFFFTYLWVLRSALVCETQAADLLPSSFTLQRANAASEPQGWTNWSFQEAIQCRSFTQMTREAQQRDTQVRKRVLFRQKGERKEKQRCSMCLLARLTSFPPPHYYYAKTLDGDWLAVKLLYKVPSSQHLTPVPLHSWTAFRAILRLV